MCIVDMQGCKCWECMYGGVCFVVFDVMFVKWCEKRLIIAVWK